MSTDKIKAKIKALLSKTIENGATKQEMESALSKANELMLEYFISEHEITDFKVIEKCVLKEVPLIQSGYDLKLFFNDLGRLFDCESYYNSKRVAFFGFEQDAELCAYFYNVIVKTCLAEKERYLKTYEFKRARMLYNSKTLAASFVKGFQLGVMVSMERLYKDRRRNVEQKYGLMVVEKQDQVSKQFAEQGVKIRKVKSRLNELEEESFIQGMESGKKVSITQGVEGYKNAQFALL